MTHLPTHNNPLISFLLTGPDSINVHTNMHLLVLLTRKNWYLGNLTTDCMRGKFYGIFVNTVQQKQTLSYYFKLLFPINYYLNLKAHFTGLK